MEMMKTFAFNILLLGVLSCGVSEDRDRLIFNNDINEVEQNIMEMDRLLLNFPEQKDPYKIQSYFFEKLDQNTILYINAIRIAKVDSLPIKRISDILRMDTFTTIKFIKIAKFLNCNFITSVINDCGIWQYTYKMSNNRGEFRSIVKNEKDKNILVNDCQREVIDKNKDLFLLRLKNRNL